MADYQVHETVLCDVNCHDGDRRIELSDLILLPNCLKISQRTAAPWGLLIDGHESRKLEAILADCFEPAHVHRYV
jgi:hypothetical protein